MKGMLQRLAVLSIAFWLYCVPVHSQVVSNDHIEDELFLYEVKQIDEFLERFNDEHFSFLRREYRKKSTDKGITRTMMLTRLFNMSNPRWNPDSLKTFLNYVLNPQNPVILSFTDSNWYAETKCVFKYKGKNVIVPLLFHVKTINPRGARWMIAGIGNPAFLSRMAMDSCSGATSPKYHFIATSSHVNRFLSLHRAFGDNTNLSDYFDPNLLDGVNTQKFIHSLCSKSLVLAEVKELKFHFFQIDGWMFTVERFERQTNNKGWLINSLSPASEAQKAARLAQLLFRQPLL